MPGQSRAKQATFKTGHCVQPFTIGFLRNLARCQLNCRPICAVCRLKFRWRRSDHPIEASSDASVDAAFELIRPAEKQLDKRIIDPMTTIEMNTEESAGNAPAEYSPESASARVVLVDDSSAVRQSARLLLKTVGLELLPYHSPVQFLQDLPDCSCILLDIRMPEISGIEVYRRLREAGVKTPVIFMTGHGQVSLAVNAMRDGAFDFLEKPVDDQKLIDVIFAAIAKDKERREAAGSRERIAEKLARLTIRERNVADLIAKGMSSREVAEKLALSVRTVEGYRGRILSKLEADSLAQLIHMLRDAQQ